MSMPKAVPNEKTRVRPTIDVILLKTLVNKRLNAEGNVFNVKVEYSAASMKWQVFVEHFKNTYFPVDPELLCRSEDMEKLADKIIEKLLIVMSQRPKVSKLGEKNEPVSHK